MPLLFPDKHINQTNLSRKYSGVMGIFSTHPCLQWVWRKKQEHGGETSEEYWFVVWAGLRKGTKGERFPHSISSPGGTQVWFCLKKRRDYPLRNKENLAPGGSIRKNTSFLEPMTLNICFSETRPYCHQCSLKTKAFLFQSSLARLTLLSYLEN